MLQYNALNIRFKNWNNGIFYIRYKILHNRYLNIHLLENRTKVLTVLYLILKLPTIQAQANKYIINYIGYITIQTINHFWSQSIEILWLFKIYLWNLYRLKYYIYEIESNLQLKYYYMNFPFLIESNCLYISLNLKNGQKKNNIYFIKSLIFLNDFIFLKLTKLINQFLINFLKTKHL